MIIREAANKVLFLKLKKKIRKKLKGEGVKALVVGPQKNNLFLCFPKAS